MTGQTSGHGWRRVNLADPERSGEERRIGGTLRVLDSLTVRLPELSSQAR
jgi:hypothetical protein